MPSFLMTLLRFFRAFWHGLKDEEFRALFYVFLSLLISGTVFYSTIEGWSVLDALYFSVITLATVGYGDLHPTTTLSKVFTIFYILVGAGIFVAFITKVTLYETRRRRPRRRKADDA